MKRYSPKDGSDEPPPGGGRNAEADFHGQKRSNCRWRCNLPHKWRLNIPHFFLLGAVPG